MTYKKKEFHDQVIWGNKILADTFCLFLTIIYSGGFNMQVWIENLPERNAVF